MNEVFRLWPVAEDPKSLDSKDEEGGDVGHPLDGEVIDQGQARQPVFPDVAPHRSHEQTDDKRDFEDDDEGLCQPLTNCFSILKLPLDEKVNSVKGEKKARIGDVGVGQPLHILVVEQPTRRGDKDLVEGLRPVRCCVFAIFWHAPSKVEVGPKVKDRSNKPKDKHLEISTLLLVLPLKDQKLNKIEQIRRRG